MGNLSKIIKKHFEVVVLFVLSFIILFLLLYNIVLNYYPTSDDISLMVNSTNIYKPVNPVKWFTVGFEDYFRVYPEWSVHSKEIVRPVANFIFYICGLLFGKNYFYYLFFNIFIHSLGIAFVFYFCRRYLEIGNLFSYLAAVIFLFTPAVTNKDYFLYLSFSLDAAVSIIIFLSFLFAIKNKSLIAFLLTFLALLTKETAMLIPFAVFLTLIVNRKKGKIKYLTIAFLIVVIWLLYKKLFDIGITAGIFNDIAGMWMMYLANILRGLFVWPSGIPDGDLSNVYLVLFVTTLNLVFIAFIFFDGYREYKSKNEKYLIAFFWSIASILIILFFGLYSRFGYAFHLFFIPFVFYNIKISKSKFRKIIYSVFCLLIFVSGVLFFVNRQNPGEIASYKHKMQSAKQLNELLKSVQDSSEVILINDYTAVFGTPFLSDFAESKIKVIKINSIANYSFFENNKNIISRINFNRLNDTLVVKIDIPGYTDFWFEGVKTELFNHEAKKQFKRNDFISILFPDEEYSGVSRLTGFNKYNFGKKMTLYVKRKLISVIWFNPAEGKYEMFRNL